MHACTKTSIVRASHACRSLGQNFVTDDSVLLDIAAAAAVSPGDIVLEVRPSILHAHVPACGVGLQCMCASCAWGGVWSLHAMWVERLLNPLQAG